MFFWLEIDVVGGLDEIKKFSELVGWFWLGTGVNVGGMIVLPKSQNWFSIYCKLLCQGISELVFIYRMWIPFL